MRAMLASLQWWWHEKTTGWARGEETERHTLTVSAQHSRSFGLGRSVRRDGGGLGGEVLLDELARLLQVGGVGRATLH